MRNRGQVRVNLRTFIQMRQITPKHYDIYLSLEATLRTRRNDIDPLSYENHSGSWSLWNSFKDEDGRRLVADRLGSHE